MSDSNVAKVIPLDQHVGFARNLLKNLTATLQRFSLARSIGLTHDGARDLYEVFGYKANPTAEDYMNKYTRQDVAARVVDAFPSATWSTPPNVEGGARMVKKWDDLVKEFQLFSVLQRVDRLLGLGEYSLLFIGLNDGNPISRPVKKTGNKQLLYLQPYSSKSLKIAEWEEDPKSERYGLPTKYSLQPENVQSAETTNVVFQRKAVDVHWSRCVHVVEDPLENEIYGVPRMQRVYNLLDDLAKVCGGTAEVFWMTANRGMQADVDKDMNFTEADASALSDEIAEYQHQQRRVIRTRGVKINNLGSDVPDPGGTFDVLVTMLAGALGIPKRILLGSEAGQLASAQDRTNWANRIEERRKNFAEPYVLWPLCKRFVELGILPALPEKFAWPSAFKMSPFEKSQTAAQKARSAANVTKALESVQNVLTKGEARAIILDTDDMDPNDIARPDDDVVPTNEPPAPPQPFGKGAVPPKKPGAGAAPAKKPVAKKVPPNAEDDA